MLSQLSNFDDKGFVTNEDLEADQDEQHLQQEEFEEYDLSDDNEYSDFNFNKEYNDTESNNLYHTNVLYNDNAFFGENGTNSDVFEVKNNSDMILNSGENAVFINKPTKVSANLMEINGFGTSDNYTSSAEQCFGDDQPKFYTTQAGLTRDAVNQNKSIDWELSLPSEIGDAILSSLQPNHTAQVIQPSCASSITNPISTGVRLNTMAQFPVTSHPNGSFPNCIPTNRTNCIVNESISQHPISNQLPLDVQDRREMLYAARGRQIQELQSEVEQLRQQLAREKRMAAHRDTLNSSEKEMLQTKINSLEDAIRSLNHDMSTKQREASTLATKLEDNETEKVKLTKELETLRLTNDSLTNQLADISAGTAIKQMHEHETQVAKTIERRCMSQAEEVRGELERSQKNLMLKESECTTLRKQLEIYKTDLNSLQMDHMQLRKQANRELEESQKHCQQLASSTVYSELVNLRHKVSDLETDKKISEEANKILQDELRSLRDQVAMYKNVLKVNNNNSKSTEEVDCYDFYDYNNNRPSVPTSKPLWTTAVATPLNNKQIGSVKSTVYDDDTSKPRSYTAPPSCRPSSCLDKPVVHFQNLSQVHGHWNSDDKLHSNGEYQNVKDNVNWHQMQNGSSIIAPFSSLKQKGICTSTPAVFASKLDIVVDNLNGQLRRCLDNYSKKCEEMTKLQEVLFATRCKLHKLEESAAKTEKSLKESEERVVTLERELYNLREIGESGSPRELVLSSQLDRFKEDYALLEEELKTTRTRLQSALGAEARALEAEKTASERLAASGAERDAAVERARAVCETHYTTMRRRFEMDWANEREEYGRKADEKVVVVKQELSNVQYELKRVNKLYQELQISSRNAVDLALSEMMHERELDRIKFWREELPIQLETARQSWLADFDASKKDLKKDCSDRHVQTDVDFTKSLCSIDTQTTIGGDTTTSIWSATGVENCPKLLELLGQSDLNSFALHFIATANMDVSTIEAKLDAYCVADGSRQLAHAWNMVAVHIEESVVRCCPAAYVDEIVERFGLDQTSHSTGPDVDVGRIRTLMMLDRIFQLLTNSNSKQPVDDARCDQSTQVTAGQSERYCATLSQIKSDVMDYVDTCQKRAAQTLHSELHRVHRRACRLFAIHMRQRLFDTNVPKEANNWTTMTSTAGSSADCVYRVHNFNISTNLESLLHLIDQVCEFTEVKYHNECLTGFSLFQPADIANCSSVDNEQEEHVAKPLSSDAKFFMSEQTEFANSNSSVMTTSCSTKSQSNQPFIPNPVPIPRVTLKKISSSNDASEDYAKLTHSFSPIFSQSKITPDRSKLHDLFEQYKNASDDKL